MKTLKAICMAVVLAFALSVPAFAGDVLTPGYVPPPPPPPLVATEPAPGEINTPGVASTGPGDAETSELVQLLLVIFSIL